MHPIRRPRATSPWAAALAAAAAAAAAAVTVVVPAPPAHAADPAVIRVEIPRASVGEDGDGICGDPEFKVEMVADDPATGRLLGRAETAEHPVSFPDLHHLPFEIHPAWSLRISVGHPAPDVVRVRVALWEDDIGSLCWSDRDWQDVDPSPHHHAALLAVDLRTGTTRPWTTSTPATVVWRGDGCAGGEGCGLPIGQLDLDVSVWRNGARVEPPPTTQPPRLAPVGVPVPVNQPPRFAPPLACTTKGAVEARFTDDGPDASLDVDLTAVLRDGRRRTTRMGALSTGPTADDVVFRATLAGLLVPLTDIERLELRAVDDLGVASPTVTVGYDVTDPKSVC
jgi:hypothetical protein